MPSDSAEEVVLGYFDTLSNRGRWGDDDERGTLRRRGASRAEQVRSTGRWRARASTLSPTNGATQQCSRKCSRAGS